MAKKTCLENQEGVFPAAEKWKKSLEVRVGYSQMRKVQKGDIITFENYGRNEFDVLQVKTYSSFEELLDKEGVDKVLPGMTHSRALKRSSGYLPEG